MVYIEYTKSIEINKQEKRNQMSHSILIKNLSDMSVKELLEAYASSYFYECECVTCKEDSEIEVANQNAILAEVENRIGAK